MPGRPFTRALAVAAATLPLTAYAFGGWAIITVDDFPETVVVARPTTLSFVVRQHGITPLGGLSPTVTAHRGKLDVAAKITAGTAGHYSSTLVLPEAGKWAITINSGFMASRVTLPVIHALDAGTSLPPALIPAERGKRLFVAKGCVTCHVHGAVADQDNKSFDVGPELTPKRYETDYLKRFLLDPSIARTPGRSEMPALGLSAVELSALVAFINNDRAVATQRH